LVWSDPRIIELSREFVPVAEEVHFLYPESARALARLKDDPGHLLFKRYSESVPEADWNATGTKQGIYMFGPDGEYLEGLHAASGHAGRLVRRLERALVRWRELAKVKSYANAPVPRGDAVAPPDVASAPLALIVYLRDLPRTADDDSGRRFNAADARNGMWINFMNWAWNQNWLTLADPTALVPEGREPQAVAPAVVERICRRALVDNVRGQNPAWRADAVEEAELSMAVIATKGHLRTIEYRGHARMKTATQRYEPRLYGQAVWDTQRKRFESFDLISIGEREGAARFNQRDEDRGPAPLGIAIGLFRPN